MYVYVYSYMYIVLVHRVVSSIQVKVLVDTLMHICIVYSGLIGRV